jgi:spore coat protein A, manganese oxidase
VQDTTQNGKELWLLEAGGGWFHPVHIHLISFFVIFRNRPGNVHSYEVLSSKDVVLLGPSERIWVIARWVPCSIPPPQHT